MKNLLKVILILLTIVCIVPNVNAQGVNGDTSIPDYIRYYFNTDMQTLFVVAPFYLNEEFVMNPVTSDGISTNMYAAAKDSIVFAGMYSMEANVAAVGKCSLVATDTGHLKLMTATNDNDKLEFSWYQALSAVESLPGFEVRITNEDVSALGFFIGYQDTKADTGAVADTLAFFITAATDTVKANGTIQNGFGILYDPDATTDVLFGANIRSGTVGATVESSTSLTDDTEIILRGTVDVDTTFRFYADGDLIGTIENVTTGGVNLFPVISMINRSANSDTLQVARWQLWQK